MWFPVENRIAEKREVKGQKKEQGQCDRGTANRARRLGWGAAPPFPSLSGRQKFLALTVSISFHRFTTKRGQKLCATLKEAWVQKYISLLRARQQP